MHLNGLSIFLADATASTPATPASGQQGAPASPAQGLFGNPFIFIVLMIVMMYFLLFRPQSQQRKRQVKLQDSLKSGDKVVTASGIVGVVISVKDKTVTLRSMDAKMEVTKSSVTEILERSGEEKSEKSAS